MSTMTTSSAIVSPEEQSRTLDSVLQLALLFGTCVEAFGLIHPSKDGDYQQKLALAKLGIQQGRLLIFGDAVGISSPPATIATHMIPSKVGPTNPDPTLPIYFEPRDSRLDEPETRKTVEAILNEIVDRPAHLDREQMMDLYGLKPPKRIMYTVQPALDNNRLDAFRERYSLLQDLSQDICSTRTPQRNRSITMQHWAVYDVQKFSAFVSMVRDQVDKLEQLFDCKDRIDKGMKADIRALGWHPEMASSVIRKDWEKLKLIHAACEKEYPEYVQTTDIALEYIDQELHGNAPPFAAVAEKTVPERKPAAENIPPKKRPGIFSHFKLSSFGKHRKSKEAEKNEKLTLPPTPTTRSHSEDLTAKKDDLEPVRSLSLPNGVPTPEMAALALDPPAGPSKMNSKAIRPDSAFEGTEGAPLVPVNTAVSAPDSDINEGLARADTINSLIERHDQFRGIGRTATKDIRDVAHRW